MELLTPARPDLSGLSDLAQQTAAMDAVETVARLVARELSQEEVVRAAVERARAWEPTLGAVVAEDYAAAMGATPAEGPLRGVPTFIKDLDDYAGLPTRMGSAALKPRMATASAGSVQEFLSTGPVVLGKSATAEFGLTCTTEPVGGRPTRNPHNLGHSVGGSSGGAAALVAAGVVPLAYGSDGGGSIRIPAACCGLVGLKATRGRLRPMDRSRMLPIQIATYGVLTRTVRDTWAFYEGVERAGVPKGLAPVGSYGARQDRPLRVGLFVDSSVGEVVDPAVVAAVEQAGRLLEDLGHSVVPVANPASRAVLEDFLRYWALLAAGVKRMVDQDPLGDAALLEPWTLGLGARLGSEWRALPGALWRLRRYTAAYRACFADLDVLLGPTMGGPAPPLGYVSPALHPDEKQPRIEQLVTFTPPQNISGAPALSLPLGRSAGGLPMGVHFGADVGQEALLLTLAAQLEAAGAFTPEPR